MTSNDNTRDGKSPAGSGLSGKRPHATLDLKAVEIKDPLRDPAHTSQASDKRDQTTPSKTSGESQVTASSDDKTSPADNARESQKTTSGSAGGNGPNNPGNGAESSSDSAAPPPQIVRRRGGFFGPVIAGILGGALAIFGGDYALQQLGIPKLAGSETQSMDAIELRLAELEQQIPSAGTDDDGNDVSAIKLDAITRQLEDLKTLPKTTVSLVEQQAELRERLDALSASTTTTADTAQNEALTQRLSTLENRLATLSAAAEADPNAGPIPQITALTEKIAELETAVANQASEQSPNLSAEDNQRIKEAATAAASAQANTERLDTTFSAVKSSTTRLEQRVEALKTEADKLSESIKILNETTLKMSSEISSLRQNLQSELGAVARPADINAAVTPYKDRIANLEANLKNLEKIEAERAAQARNVVLSLELAELERSVNAGKPFAEQLNAVKASAGEAIELGELEKHATQGVATLATLQESFRPVIYQIMQATKPSEDASLIGRIVDQAKSVIRVRRVAHDEKDTSVEAIIARMEDGLKAGNLTAVLQHSEALPEANKAPAQGWLDQVAARTKVTSAMETLQSTLKSSLSNTSLTRSR